MRYPDFVTLDHETLTITVNFKGQLPLIIHLHDPQLAVSYFSHGHGGQNLNKHQNGVRLIYTVPENYRRPDRPERTIEVRCHEQRHQRQNLELAFKHLSEKLRGYFYVAPPRTKTQIPHYASRERLEGKKHRSKKKSLRQPLEPDDNHFV